MNWKSILKMVVVAAMAAVGVGGAEYVATDAVSWSAAASAAVAAVIAYLKKSPLA